MYVGGVVFGVEGFGFLVLGFLEVIFFLFVYIRRYMICIRRYVCVDIFMCIGAYIDICIRYVYIYVYICRSVYVDIL